jgi:hypothetical protein
MSRDLTPLYGKHLWVWYVDQSGGVDGIIQTARDTGAQGVLIKCADGTTPWTQFAESVDALKTAGLVVGAWAYIYPSDPQAQVEAPLNASQGADYLVLDAETEWEAPGMDTQAEAFGRALRVLAPDIPVGLTTFALPKLHRAFPYLAFAGFVDAILPQVYWADAGLDPQAMLFESIAQLTGYGKQILPVGQAYAPATPAQIDLFCAYCVEKWIEGVSWWDLQSMDPGNKAAIAYGRVYVPAHREAKKVAPAPVAHGLDAKQEATVAEIEKLAEELKSE